MIRIIITNFLLFMLPFALYALYIFVARRGQTPKSIWGDAPIQWLLMAGCLLVIATISYLISFESGAPDKTYHPAVVKDGRLEPGRIE